MFRKLVWLCVVPLVLIGYVYVIKNVLPKEVEIYQTTFAIADLVEMHRAISKLKDGDTLKLYTIGVGGSADVCIGMINVILEAKGRGVHVITTSYGETHSANAFLWLVGDERVTHVGDLLMFHSVAIYDIYGRKVTDLDKCTQDGVDHTNEFLWKFTRLRVGSAEIFEDMFDEDQNFFSGEQLYELGIATKLIKGE